MNKRFIFLLSTSVLLCAGLIVTKLTAKNPVRAYPHARDSETIPFEDPDRVLFGIGVQVANHQDIIVASTGLDRIDKDQ